MGRERCNAPCLVRAASLCQRAIISCLLMAAHAHAPLLASGWSMTVRVAPRTVAEDHAKRARRDRPCASLGGRRGFLAILERSTTSSR